MSAHGMANRSVDTILPNLPIASRYLTAFAIPNGILILVLTLLLIRPTFTLADAGMLTFPLRSHLVNSLMQTLFWLGPNIVYICNPDFFQVYSACVTLVQLNAFFILASLSNTCFYVVAVHVQIVQPLYQHVWFSRTRRRLALALVWLVPVVYASVPTFILMIKRTDIWQVLPLCYAHILEPWYVYTYPMCGGVYVIFLVFAVVNILRTSRKQIRQIASLRVAVTSPIDVPLPCGPRSNVARTYLIVAVVTGLLVEMVVVTNVAILNVAIASCGKETCLYTYSGGVILTAFMDGLVLTVIKFRITGSRLKELVLNVF